MSLINIVNMTFAHEGSKENIFENVSFQIDTDWRLGFTGRNGRGKTTFLRLLMGKHEYSGSIYANVDFEYFPYEIPDKGMNAIDVVMGICSGCQNWEVEKELSLLSVSKEVLDEPFANLSNGEQTKVLLAALFLKENSFLLIDEPTNHLDIGAREQVGKYLSKKAGYILVSHDRAFLDNCVDHILAINKTNIEIQKGNFSSWLINKERQDAFELSENERLKKDIKRLRQSSRQSGEWADKVEATKIGKGSADIEKTINSRAYIGEKSRRMQQRKKNIDRRRKAAADEKSSLLKNVEKVGGLKIAQLNYHKNCLISMKGVSIFYGARVACENIVFSIEAGERVALCGKNGSGKTSIIRLICGENMSYTGEMQVGAGLLISRVSQDTSTLCGSLSRYASMNDIDESLFKAILSKLDFSREQFENDMRNFSGGQKKKVLIARSLCERAHLHVWDEPLNFIDVISRMQIERLIIEFKPTILFVEHDAAFCDNIATKKIYL